MRARIWAVLLIGSASLAAQTDPARRKPDKPAGTPLAPASEPKGGGIGLDPDLARRAPGQAVETTLPFSSYQVGPEDLLLVTVVDAPEFSRQLRVSGAGTIKLPLFQKPIVALGKSCAQLETDIAQALIEEGLLRDPSVSVTLLDFQSKPVSVSGAVRMPVVFQATRPLSLVEALSRAGGVTEQAGGEVLVSMPERAGRPAEVVRVPLRSLLENPASQHDLLLRGGEEIRVLPAGRIYVLGAVQRPGTVPLPGDEPLTLLRALALAGGTTPTASSRLILIRQTQGGVQQREISLNLKKLVQRKTPDLPLDANDLVFIPDSGMKKLRDTGLSSALTSLAYATTGLLIWR